MEENKYKYDPDDNHVEHVFIGTLLLAGVILGLVGLLFVLDIFGIVEWSAPQLPDY